MSSTQPRQPLRRVLSVGFLGVLPLVLTALVVYEAVAGDVVATDFTHVYLPGAEAVLAGRSPLDEPDLLAFVYTPTIAWVTVPFTLLPIGVAQGVASALLLACLPASLWVLGVRDWRVYGIVLLWPAVAQGFQTANLTFLLCLLAALAWRQREHAWGPGLWIGLGLALKPILWPLGVWLAFTHRWRSLGLALGLLSLSLVLVLPYEGIDDFVGRIRDHTDFHDEHSYTLYAFLVGLGAPEEVALAGWLGIGAAALFLARRSFSGCVVSALVLTPLAWVHYFALLALPLAILGAPLWIWLIPVAGWLVPGYGLIEPQHVAVMLGVLAVAAWFTLRAVRQRAVAT